MKKYIIPILSLSILTSVTTNAETREERLKNLFSKKKISLEGKKTTTQKDLEAQLLNKALNSEVKSEETVKEEEKIIEEKPEIKEPVEIKYEFSKTGKTEFLTPYKPKAIGIVPKKWKLEEIPKTLVKNDDITLDNNKSTSLKVSVYRIVPNNEKNVNTFVEPGFEPYKGINQDKTLGAIFTQYVVESHKIEKNIEVTLSDIEEQIDNLLNKNN